MTSAPPRRFYAQARATPDKGVALDAYDLKTPGGTRLIAPTAALAGAIAEEWGAQGERIAPSTMPLTRLGFAAIDWAPRSRDELAAYVAGFAETDLCCHRAEAPPDLIARQAAAWDPLVAWGRDAHGLSLPVVTGVIAASVEAAAIESLKAHAAALDDFRLTALAQAAGLAGSALVALALIDGRIDAETAYRASALDTLWSLERWGEDEEARARLDRQRAEFESLAQFIKLAAP